MIPWDQLFEVLFELLEDCGDDEVQRMQTMKTRPFAVRVAAARACKQCGVRGRAERRSVITGVMDQIDIASDDELKAFASGGPTAVAKYRTGV